MLEGTARCSAAARRPGPGRCAKQDIASRPAICQGGRHLYRRLPGNGLSSNGFTIYVDAETSHIRRWYIERFLALRRTAFQDPLSYFHRYANLTDDQAETEAARIWREINEPNLLENILPTRDPAHLVLEKGPDHLVEQVQLRKR